MTILRYGRIWLAQMRYSLAREMMFKGNFLLWIVVELCWFVLQLCFVQVLYFQVESIAGWSKWEMVLLVSTSHLVQQLFMAFLMVNCMQLPENIRIGKLDFFLAQPASTQFLVSTRMFDLGGLVNALVALLLCIYAAWQVPVSFTVFNLAAYLLLVLMGVAVHYSLMLSLMTAAFWITRAQGFVTAYYNAFNIARLPREAFRGPARFIFTWLVPMLLVANVPAQTLLQNASGRAALYLAAITVFLLWGSNRLFRFGMNHYTSASS